MKPKDTIVLGVLFACAVLITIYFKPDVLENPFTPAILLVFYIILIASHFPTPGEHREYTRKLEQDKLDEIRDSLKQHKSMTEIKTKIKSWKKEGYNIEEIEKMIEEIKI